MIPKTVKEQAAYTKGQIDHGEHNVPFDANPFPGGKTLSGFNPLRYWWFVGWLDAKHEAEGMLP